MTIEKLPGCLSEVEGQDRAVSVLRSYYGVAGDDGFEGRFFDTWPDHDIDPNRFCPEDVIATSFLSIHVPASAARAVLAAGDNNPYNELLREIPRDVDFWDADPPNRESPQWRLEKRLTSLHGVGLTTASKLMARKRPRLIPIIDTVVRAELGLHRAFWSPLFQLFQDAALRGRLTGVATAAREAGVLLPPGISTLRLFDVIVWMAATKEQGASEPQIGDELLEGPARRSEKRNQAT